MDGMLIALAPQERNYKVVGHSIHEWQKVNLTERHCQFMVK